MTSSLLCTSAAFRPRTYQDGHHGLLDLLTGGLCRALRPPDQKSGSGTRLPISAGGTHPLSASVRFLGASLTLASCILAIGPLDCHSNLSFSFCPLGHPQPRPPHPSPEQLHWSLPRLPTGQLSFHPESQCSFQNVLLSLSPPRFQAFLALQYPSRRPGPAGASPGHLRAMSPCVLPAPPA